MSTPAWVHGTLWLVAGLAIVPVTLQEPAGKTWEPHIVDAGMLRDIEGNFCFDDGVSSRRYLANGTVGDTIKVVLDSDDRELRCRWTYSIEGSPWERETLVLDYTPTAICGLDTFGEYLVAGTCPSGRMFLDRLVLAEKGAPPHLVTVADLEARRGRQDVYHLLPNLADPDRFFVLFWDRRELHELDLATGELRLVVSPDSESGALTLPELAAGRFGLVYARPHRDLGYVYFFSSYGVDLWVELELAATLILCDVDRDGLLDDVHVADSTTTWEGLGLSDSDAYED